MGFNLVVYFFCPSHSFRSNKKTTPPRPNRFKPKPAAGKVYVKVKFFIWFKFYFTLFLGNGNADNKLKTIK